MGDPHRGPPGPRGHAKTLIRHSTVKGLALAGGMHRRVAMQPVTIALVPEAANDLPAPVSAARARRPERDRRLRGPIWSEPQRQVISA